MINKKNSWYDEAKQSSVIMQEAGMKDNLQLSILAVGLLLGGASILEVANETGLGTNQIEQLDQAKNNPEMVEKVHQQFNQQPIQPPKNQNMVDQNRPKHGLSTELNRAEIEKLVRKHEISGAERYVDVYVDVIVEIDGKKVKQKQKRTYDIRKAYPDPIHGWKVPTIGVGYNMNKSDTEKKFKDMGLNYKLIRSKGQSLENKDALTDTQVNLLYGKDIDKAILEAKSFLDNFDQQPSEVKTIIIDMIFNMGLEKLKTFVNLREALLNFNFYPAAHHMKDSEWYKQTGDRAKFLIKKMQNVYEPKNEYENNTPNDYEKPIHTN
jgi:hypothetical protein